MSSTYIVFIYKERDDDDTRGIYVQLGRTSGNRYTKESDPNYIQQRED